MPSARLDHRATVLLTGQVLVTGGLDESHQRLATADLFDPVTGRWRRVSPMAIARLGHTSTLLENGQVLVAGGYEPRLASTFEELYVPQTGTWVRTSNLIHPRRWHTAVLLSNGQVLACGGEQNQALVSAEIFDPIAAPRPLPLMAPTRWPKPANGRLAEEEYSRSWND